MRTSILRLLLVAVPLAGCGSNNPGAVTDFITAMATQQCAWEFRCCTDPEIKTLDGRKFTGMDDCVPYRTLALENTLFLDRLAAREGRLRVDGDAAAACLDSMQNRVCNPKPGMTTIPVDPMAEDPCVNVLVGNTAPGDECIYTHECQKGARCVADATVVGRGVCVPYQSESAICNTAADCDPAIKQLYCAKDDFQCHLRAKLGEQCKYTTDANGTNPTLPLLLECDNGLGNVYCDPVTSTCKQLPGDGEACLAKPAPDVGRQCDPDFVCVSTNSTTPSVGTCKGPGKLGEDCSTTTLGCEKTLYCDSTTLRCKALPTLGGNCQTSGGRCATPYFCNSQKTPEVCDQPAAINQDCSLTPCGLDLFCDPTLRVCQAQLPDGSTCTTSIQCLSDLCSTTAGSIDRTCQPTNPTAVQCVGRN